MVDDSVDATGVAGSLIKKSQHVASKVQNCIEQMDAMLTKPKSCLNEYEIKEICRKACL